MFMHEMNDTLGDLIGLCVVCYLDDILVFSKTKEEHVKHLRMVFQKLSDRGLILKEAKCEFFRTEVDFLGLRVTSGGLRPQDRKIEKIRNWPAPVSVTQVRSFLGLAGFYRRFVKGFSEIAAPLTNLLRKEHKFTWTEQCQKAFDTLKEKLSSDSVLAVFDPMRETELVTDASLIGIGGVLHQKYDEGWRPVAFFSRKLNPTEQRYHTPDRELMALVESLKEWEHYLMGRKFGIRTDQRSLQSIMNKKEMDWKQMKWIQYLNMFDASITYIEGRANVVADALSRQGLPQEAEEAAAEPDFSSLRKKILSYITCYAVKTQEPEKAKFEFELEDYSEEERKLYAGKEFYIRDGTYWKVGKVRNAELGYREPDRMCIPAKANLKTKILEALHDDPLAGHLGESKTRTRVQRRFYWPKMREDIEKHVLTCESCQRNKTKPHKKYGLMSPLPIPEGP
jgi:hypothetical protein